MCKLSIVEYDVAIVDNDGNVLVTYKGIQAVDEEGALETGFMRALDEGYSGDAILV